MISFNLIKKTRANGWGGVAIGCKKHIKMERIKYRTNQDILIAKTTNLRENLTICTAYLNPSINSAVVKIEVEKLMATLQRHSNVILLGDFNAKNTIWGNCRNDIKGKILASE